MGVSTQASTLSSFQTKTERGINGIQDDMKRQETKIMQEFTLVNAAGESAKKRDWIVMGLLAMNAMAVIALFIALYVH